MTENETTEPGGFAEFTEELRLLAEVLLQRAEPLLRQAGSPQRPPADNCRWCPVCALAALVRGQHHETVAALAEHGTALVTILREALVGVPVDPVVSHPRDTTWPGTMPHAPDCPHAQNTATDPEKRTGYVGIPVTITT